MIALSACQVTPNRPSHPVTSPPTSGAEITQEPHHVSNQSDNFPSQVQLWDALETGFVIGSLHGRAARDMANQLDFFKSRGFLENSIRRSPDYLTLFHSEVQQRGLPSELALIPIVESGLRAQATSPKGAHGTWQFMPATARQYGLVVNHLVDQRRDLLLATNAALDFLTELEAQFSNWHLAIGAYNCGPACVARNRRASIQRGEAGHFEELRLPQETRLYVARIMALRELIRERRELGLQLPELAAASTLAIIPVQQDVDVDTVLAVTGLTRAEFNHYNPAVTGPLIISAWTPRLLLPVEAAKAWQRQPSPPATWTLAHLDRSISVAKLASNLGLKESEFRSINTIPRGNHPVKGSLLLVPKRVSLPPGLRPVSSNTLHLAQLKLQPDIRVVNVKVKRGDSLWKIARNYKVSISDIARWNKISPKSILRVGQTLRLEFPG